MRSPCAPQLTSKIMKHLWLIAVCLGIVAAACWLTRAPAPAQPVLIAHHSLPPMPVDSTAPPESIADVIAEQKTVTLREGADLLLRGHAWLQTVPDYTAVFRKQERVGGELRSLETTELKLRHVPFSVALTWQENGRIAFYHEGTNQNRMSVRMGGWKRRLGWINLDPHATLAMSEARYPITDVGLMRLTEQLLERFAPYLDRTDGVRCTWLPDEAVGGRRCHVFVAEYANSAVNPDYRKSIVWFDAEWSVPLAVQNFDWLADDPANPEGLVEYYAYENVLLDPSLHDADFAMEGHTGSPSEVAASAGR